MSHLDLRAGLVKPSRWHVVTVVVVDAQGLNNSYTTLLAVKESVLVAEISGGDRIAGATDTVTADASASYDPDVQDLTGEEAGLEVSV